MSGSEILKVNSAAGRPAQFARFGGEIFDTMHWLQRHRKEAAENKERHARAMISRLGSRLGPRETCCTPRRWKGKWYQQPQASRADRSSAGNRIGPGMLSSWEPAGVRGGGGLPHAKGFERLSGWWAGATAGSRKEGGAAWPLAIPRPPHPVRSADLQTSPIR
jgi:hypothetical protein